MGVFDEVEGIQIKLLDCSMNEYKVGDKIDLDDGCYIGYEGAFIVKEKTIMGVAYALYTKWGDKVKAEDILDSKSPIVRYLKKREKK